MSILYGEMMAGSSGVLLQPASTATASNVVTVRIDALTPARAVRFGYKTEYDSAVRCDGSRLHEFP
jgi:hypothetical protein